MNYYIKVSSQVDETTMIHLKNYLKGKTTKQLITGLDFRINNISNSYPYTADILFVGRIIFNVFTEEEMYADINIDNKTYSREYLKKFSPIKYFFKIPKEFYRYLKLMRL